MHRVLISLPEDLLAAADGLAAELQITRSELVRRSLSDSLERQAKQALRELCAEGYQALADEDLAEAEAYTGTASR